MKVFKANSNIPQKNKTSNNYYSNQGKIEFDSLISLKFNE